MAALIIVLVISVITLFVVFKSREESKESVIAQLETKLCAKASITYVKEIYIYSFTIKGNYKERDLILSVIYGVETTASHAELCEVTVTVPLTPNQKEKYGCGRRNAKLSEAVKGLFGMPFSRINVGAFELEQMFLLGTILPPSYSRIQRLIDMAVDKAREL